MRSKILVNLGLVFLFGMILSGCAMGVKALNQASQEPVVYDPAKSYVYFYRPYVMTGAAIGFWPFDDVKSLGVLGCRTYYVYEMAPGEHVFYANANKQDESRLKLVAEPGKKYFVKCAYRPKFLFAVPTLSLMNNVDEKQMRSYVRLDQSSPPPLNTNVSGENPYFQIVRQRIFQACWSLYSERKTGEVLLSIELAPDGKVLSVGVDKDHSTASLRIIQSTLQAVKMADPFPPVPTEVLGQNKSIVFKMILDYQVQQKTK